MSHAKLSPSAARRWMTCLGSYELNKDAPEDAGEYADEGTAAHEVGAHCLQHGHDAKHMIGETINVCNEDGTVRRSFVVDDDMASYVQVYVDSIRDRLHETAQLFVEQRVDTGIAGPEGSTINGTADALIASPTFGLLEVHDLKYGRGNMVHALTALGDPQAAVGPLVMDEHGQLFELNPQLALYGLGAIRDFDWLGPYKTIRLAIHQPRLDHMSVAEISYSDLLAWHARVEEIAARIVAGDQTLVPSEAGCKWCSAKAMCPALERHTAQTVMQDFGNVADLTEHGLGQALERLSLVRQWADAIEAAARAALDAGKRIPGWVLDQGRAGNRKWKDEKVVEALLKKTYRLKREEMYNSKLISPTDAEKLLKSNPTRWERLQEHITRGEPTVKLVRESEAKNPINPGAVADDFKDLVGG